MRHTVFKAQIIKQGSVWSRVCAAAEHDLDELLERHGKQLMKLVHKAFATIWSAFNDIKTTDSDDPAEARQRAVLAECLRKAEKCMGGEMKSAYESLRKSFPET